MLSLPNYPGIDHLFHVSIFKLTINGTMMDRPDLLFSMLLFLHQLVLCKELKLIISINIDDEVVLLPLI